MALKRGRGLVFVCYDTNDKSLFEVDSVPKALKMAFIHTLDVPVVPGMRALLNSCDKYRTRAPLAKVVASTEKNKGAKGKGKKPAAAAAQDSESYDDVPTRAQYAAERMKQQKLACQLEEAKSLLRDQTKAKPSPQVATTAVVVAAGAGAGPAVAARFHWQQTVFFDTSTLLALYFSAQQCR